MLAVGRALMLRPRLMLLDEPSFGLAPLIVEELFNILRTINQTEQVSMLLVEQNAPWPSIWRITPICWRPVTWSFPAPLKKSPLTRACANPISVTRSSLNHGSLFATDPERARHWRHLCLARPGRGDDLPGH